MSLEVLRADFEAHKVECNKDRYDIKASLREILATMKFFVTFEYFHWVIGVLMVILMAVLGYIVVQIKDLSGTSNIVREDVSYLKGTLDGYDIRLEK